MKHKSASLAPGRRARHLFVAATLASALALSLAPYGPARPGVATAIALTDPSAAPSESPPPDPGATPTPEVTPDPTPTDTPLPTDTPAPTAEPTPPPTDTPVPTDTLAPTDTPVPTDTPPPTDTPLPTVTPTPSPSGTPSPGPSDTPSASPSPTAGIVVLHLTSSAPDVGRHRVEPGAHLVVSLSIHAETDVRDGLLIASIPDGWAVNLTDGGSVDAAAGTVTWHLEGMGAGDVATTHVDVMAPRVPTLDGRLVLPATFNGRLEQGDTIDAAPPLSVIVAPRIAIPHFAITRVGGQDPTAQPLPADTAIRDLQRYEVFRVRFEVRNPDSVPVRWTPQLQYRESRDPTFAAVPAGDNVDGIPVYAAPEWVATSGPAGGTIREIGVDPLPAALLAIGGLDPDGQTIADGLRSTGVNPLTELTLPADSVTAIEFNVRATADAPYGSGIEFRLTDAGSSFVGAVQPVASLGTTPDLELSAGQRTGAAVPDAGGLTAAEALAAQEVAARVVASPPPLQYPLEPPTSSVQYPLEPPSGAPSAAGPVTAADAPTATADRIHGPYSMTTDACAACHRTHAAQGAELTADAAPEFGLCATCHNGTIAAGGANIVPGYSAAPTNDPSTRSYYQHDPAAVAGHTSVGSESLAGVSNRHNECADCHGPHRTLDTSAVPAIDGWATAGANAGAPGVAVTNGPAGSVPSFTPVNPTTAEYQLCFRCHSGYTVLPDDTGQLPSRYALDKSVEFNPANLSYHPIEAPGTNTTPAMAASLAGSSPYKLWNFTTASTVRCVNCHADSRTVTSAAASPDPSASPVPSPTPSPSLIPVSADANLDAHASENRGILIQRYLDRSLKSWTEAYNAADFALCYLCHAEAPFVDTSGNERSDTNFRYHGVHVSGANLIGHGSTSTAIDTPGAGGGLATCAECHFRIHSTTYAVPGQTISGERLVNFAPDVEADALSGTLNWSVKTPTQAGTCTLTCHGQPHRPKTY